MLFETGYFLRNISGLAIISCNYFSSSCREFSLTGICFVIVEDIAVGIVPFP